MDAPRKTRVMRGRKPRVWYSVAARADDLLGQLRGFAAAVDWSRLTQAMGIDDVEAAFAGVDKWSRERFFELAPPALILKWVREGKFPRKKPDLQIRHLADSAAGGGLVSLRRSRDICQAERRRLRKQGRIIRAEFYVVCSCGYKGPAKNNACRRCGAPVWESPTDQVILDRPGPSEE